MHCDSMSRALIYASLFLEKCTNFTKVSPQ